MQDFDILMEEKNAYKQYMIARGLLGWDGLTQIIYISSAIIRQIRGIRVLLRLYDRTLMKRIELISTDCLNIYPRSSAKSCSITTIS